MNVVKVSQKKLNSQNRCRVQFLSTCELLWYTTKIFAAPSQNGGENQCFCFQVHKKKLDTLIRKTFFIDIESK